ncbi:unnamed protein product, partial [Rotaria socialis]
MGDAAVAVAAAAAELGKVSTFEIGFFIGVGVGVDVAGPVVTNESDDVD